MKLKKIKSKLQKLSNDLDLETLSKEYLVVALQAYQEDEPDEYAAHFGDHAPGSVKAELFKQSLVFYHILLEDHYIDTELRLTGKDNAEVGSYRLISDIDGNAVDDYLVL